MKTEYIIGLVLLVVVGGGIYFLQGNTTGMPKLAPGDFSKNIMGNTYKSFPYREIAEPAGFLNTPKPFKLADLVGKKVILLDILTYSCINCQRTFPYLNAWYDKYKDQGLEIVGIHAPEFAFEKDPKNVQKALEEFGIKFPIVLDNNYGTWRAYENNVWPRKFLIDIYGNVVYDHSGEGEYDETEAKIQELLFEKERFLGEKKSVPLGTVTPSGAVDIRTLKVGSHETYFGSARNEYLGNGTAGKSGVQTFDRPADIKVNTLYLGGKWNLQPEYAESLEEGSQILYIYGSKEVYLVAGSDTDAEIAVYQDGVLVTPGIAGKDVAQDGTGRMKIADERLYTLISNKEAGQHTLLIVVKKGKIKAHAFTFG